MLNTRSLVEVLQSILAKNTTEALAILVTIAWDLWFYRIKIDNMPMHPMEAINYAFSLQLKYKDARDGTHKPSLGKQLWIPPEIGSLKLNVDGAIFLK